MKNLDTPLLALESASIAVGYKILDALTRVGSIKVIDASPCGGGRFLILATGSSDALKGAFHDLRRSVDGFNPDDIVDHDIVDGSCMQLLEALYSLPQVPLEESLLVIETETVSGLLPIAQVLISSLGLNAIEIKIQRSARGGAYGFFTGSAKSCAPAAEDARTRLRGAMREGRVELIESPADAFRSFFNLSGAT